MSEYIYRPACEDFDDEEYDWEYVRKWNLDHYGTLQGEIVRCRDCEHYREHEWVIATDIEHVCHFWHGEPTKVEPDGFCAWAERRKK